MLFGNKETKGRGLFMYVIYITNKLKNYSGVRSIIYQGTRCHDSDTGERRVRRVRRGTLKCTYLDMQGKRFEWIEDAPPC